jgi:ectoine hydroxylase-related dioxygenase (phytanoyl-CoA dioxygenase family)
VERYFDMLIYKPPGHPYDTPWHKDMAYSQVPVADRGVVSDNSSLQFWIALDDVDAETGCMHFIPGQHEGPLLAHKVVSGQPDDPRRLLALVDWNRARDMSHVVARPLPAGGCTFHAAGTPHYTPPNRSSSAPAALTSSISARLPTDDRRAMTSPHVGVHRVLVSCHTASQPTQTRNPP